LVLDIHHHWCREGEYIRPTDDRFARVIDSWRGVRPAIHYSYSRDTALPEGFTHNTMPNFPALLEAGHKKGKLRAHSDYYPNNAVNDYALSFLPYADIMCESKCKNLASIALYKYNEGKQYELSKQNVQQQELELSTPEFSGFG
jgi:UV DNA damage repair endonuclease